MVICCANQLREFLLHLTWLRLRHLDPNRDESVNKHAPAQEGPLKPGLIGIVAKIDKGNGRVTQFLVQTFQGRAHWYPRPALVRVLLVYFAFALTLRVFGSSVQFIVTSHTTMSRNGLCLEVNPWRLLCAACFR